MTTPATAARPARLRGLLLAGLLTLLVAAALVSLGNWQMRRLAWKEALIARVEEGLAAEPIALDAAQLPYVSSPKAAELFLDRFEYRRIRLRGVFQPRMTAFAFTSLSDAKGPLSGPGYWALTAFDPESESDYDSIFVNRGFVPYEWLGDVPPPPSGEVTITGVVRRTEPRSWFSPKPDHSKEIWFTRDMESIGSYFELYDSVRPFFIDLDAAFTPPGGIPQAGETRTRFTNNHLGYAITWYGLALALLGVFASFAWARLREDR